MTGKEILVEKMFARGCTKQQTEAKVVDVVLDILARDAGILPGYALDFEKQLREKESELAGQKRALNIKMAEFYRSSSEKGIRQREWELEEREQNVGRRERDVKQREEKLAEREEQIMAPETPEMRNRVRMAKLFDDSTRVATKYDNTAYIRGLAAILSGTPQEEVK